MICFFDTSALVKLFHEEMGSAAVESLILDEQNEIWALELVRLEFYSSICRRYRLSELTETDFNNVLNDFEEQLLNFNIEPMGSIILREAEQLIKDYGQNHGLKSLDALHLGAFRLLSDGNWLFVCADDKLCEIAEKCSLKVKNPVRE